MGLKSPLSRVGGFICFLMFWKLSRRKPLEKVLLLNCIRAPTTELSWWFIASCRAAILTRWKKPRLTCAFWSVASEGNHRAREKNAAYKEPFVEKSWGSFSQNFPSQNIVKFHISELENSGIEHLTLLHQLQIQHSSVIIIIIDKLNIDILLEKNRFLIWYHICLQILTLIDQIGSQRCPLVWYRKSTKADQ